MKKMIALAALAGLATSAAATSIVKPPDIGPWWHPIDGDNGTYVYASDFVLTGTDTKVDRMGTWLSLIWGGTQNIRFEVWGDTGGFGPNPNDVLASTGSIHPAVGVNLDYHEAPAAFSANLVPGSRYWFIATVVSEGGGGGYQTGGHTQNSVYNDNGTFWYSNDPAGMFFDGQNLTPQMAFAVHMVPAPGALALMGLGGLVAARRRR
ncbi:MAG TPA: PEP-CTERM sorting domain-containing protein [Phycisphaerales bacterium]|nr:PEP-CTERM sorting domain-containing protein [Phycisphaerales bacterium]